MPFLFFFYFHLYYFFLIFSTSSSWTFSRPPDSDAHQSYPAHPPGPRPLQRSPISPPATPFTAPPPPPCRLLRLYTTSAPPRLLRPTSSPPCRLLRRSLPHLVAPSYGDRTPPRAPPLLLKPVEIARGGVGHTHRARAHPNQPW
jgi:hypothetical protein